MRKVFTWVPLVFFGVAVLVALSLRWPTPKEDAQAPKIVQITDSAGLLVRGGVGESSLDPGALTHLWVMFQNVSKKPLTRVRIVDLQPFGFERTGDCWNGKLPACDADGQKMKTSEQALAVGASVVLSADLKADVAGRYTMAATYAWDNPEGGELRNTLQLGPVDITRPIDRYVTALGRRVRDLAIPILLLIAGAWVQRTQSRRDAAHKEAEDARSQAQAKTTAVLDSLLKMTNDRNEKYYVPLLTRTSDLIQQIRGAKAARATRQAVLPTAPALEIQAADEALDQTEQSCAHSLLRFFRQNRVMRQDLGGPSFQSRKGENVLAGAWGAFLTLGQRHFEKDLRMAATETDVHVSFAVFRQELAGAAPVDAARRVFVQKIVAWLRHPSEPMADVIPLLTLFHDVLYFEINRPFEVWYGEPEEFKTASFEQTRAKLKALPADWSTIVDDRLGAWNEFIEDGKAWEARRQKLLAARK